VQIGYLGIGRLCDIVVVSLQYQSLFYFESCYAFNNSKLQLIGDYKIDFSFVISCLDRKLLVELRQKSFN